MTPFAFPRILCILLASCLFVPALFAGGDDDIEGNEVGSRKSVWDVIMAGSKEEVSELLDDQFKLLSYGMDGEQGTLLHLAALRGDPGILALIMARMERGALRAIVAGENDEWTPLHVAVDQGHLAATSLLIREERRHIGGVDHDDESRSITPFYLAALQGNVSMLWVFYGAGYSIEVRAPNGATLLHAAAQEGHVDAVLALLSMDEYECLDLVNIEDDEGWTPLHTAALNGHEAVVRALIQAEVDADARTLLGFTAEDFALMNGHHGIAEMIEHYRVQYESDESDTSSDEDLDDHRIVELQQVRARSEAFSESGFSLFVAALAGNGALVESYLNMDDLDDEEIDLALRIAIAFQHEHIAVLLLRGGADPFYTDEVGRTLLHAAVAHENPGVLHVLLEAMQAAEDRAFDLDLEDAAGKTPLIWAIEQYEMDPGNEALELIIASLLRHGANLDYVDEDDGGRTYWHRAVGLGDDRLLRVFMGVMESERPDLYFDWEDNEGWTPFQEAAWLGNVEGMRLLAHAGARLDFPQEALADLPEVVVQALEELREAYLDRAIHCIDILGFAPLHRAVAAMDWHKVWWLLSEGAPIDVEDADGFTPLHIAALRGFEDIVDLLLLWGANPGLLNHEGESPRMLAEREGHAGVVGLIEDAEADQLVAPIVTVDIPLALRADNLLLGQPDPGQLVHNPLVPGPHPNHGQRVFYFGSF